MVVAKKENNHSNKVKLSVPDKIYMGIIYVFLGLFIVAVAYPLIYVLACSFSDPKALVAGKVFLWPVDFSLLGYQTVFQTKQVWVGYRNSLIYTSVGTVLSVFTTLCAAFPLTRQEFGARKPLTWFYTLTMFLSGGLIPSYLVMRNLKLMNSMWALILPGLVSAWSIVICRTFLQSNIPNEMYEAASIDGCSYFQFFFSIVLPLSKAVMAVMALNYATGAWNSYFGALLYIDDANKFPLQLILKNILVSNIVDFTSMDLIDARDMMTKRYLSELLKYSLIIVSSIPLLLFYPFIQKYFIQGVMIGSIKG